MSYNVIDQDRILGFVNQTRLLNRIPSLRVTGLSQKLLKDNMVDIFNGEIKNNEERQKANEIIKRKIYNETYGDDVEIYEKFYPTDYREYFNEPFLLRDDVDFIAVQAVQFAEKTFIKTLLII